jgi:hypothetical protein
MTAAIKRHRLLLRRKPLAFMVRAMIDVAAAGCRTSRPPPTFTGPAGPHTSTST